MRNLWCIYIFLLWRRFQTHRFIAAHLALNASKALVKISSITKTALSAFHRCQKICVNEQPKSVWWSTIKWQFNWIYECDSETASYIYDCFVLLLSPFSVSLCLFSSCSCRFQIYNDILVNDFRLKWVQVHILLFQWVLMRKYFEMWFTCRSLKYTS